jgi:hypothetical protein
MGVVFRLFLFDVKNLFFNIYSRKKEKNNLKASIYLEKTSSCRSFFFFFFSLFELYSTGDDGFLRCDFLMPH